MIRTIVGQSVFALIAALALVPLALVLIGPLVGARFSQAGDLGTTAVIYFNSWLLALIVSTAGSAIAFYLVFVRRALAEAALVTLAFLFLPGEIVGVGTDRLLGSVLPFSGSAVQKFAFVTALIGYVLPYVIISMVLALLAIGPRRLAALVELTSSPGAEGRVLLRAYWRQLLIAWLIGVNMTICESPRTARLQEDLFGLGRRFFGPSMTNLFQASGVELAFVALSLLPFALVIILLLPTARSPKTTPSPAPASPIGH